MNEPTILICGTSPRDWLRTGAPAAQVAAAIRGNSCRMKAAAAALCAHGIPLRKILLPYVDTVVLDERTTPLFFGGRMLLSCVEPKTVQAVLAALPVDSSTPVLRSYSAATPDALRRLLHRRAEPQTRLRAFLPQEQPDAPGGQLVCYTFAAGKLTEPERNPMKTRARARAVLAFGDILNRVVRKAGGELLCCAEDTLLCFWPGTEPDTLPETLQTTYATQLAPTLGGAPRMKRTVYAPGGVQ